MEHIKRNHYDEPDRAELQEKVIERVEENFEYFLQKYNQLPESHNGRFINSDLFKELFPEYSESKESRTRYNAVVHNAAAVLASEQYRRIISDPKREGNEVVFLTGIPGAGKTSSVVSAGQLESKYKVVFEGQLSRPDPAIPKIQAALDAGLKPVIFAVHTPPESALENTFTRFNKIGRGASISLMAEIQGNLPKGLTTIREHFKDKNVVRLAVVDKTDPEKTVIKNGWQNITTLQKEGTHEQIKQRLANALEQARSRISDACYDQARGRIQRLVSRDTRLVTPDSGTYGQDEQGRSVQKGDNRKDILLKAASELLKSRLPEGLRNDALNAAQAIVATKIEKGGKLPGIKIEKDIERPGPEQNQGREPDSGPER